MPTHLHHYHISPFVTLQAPKVAHRVDPLDPDTLSPNCLQSLGCPFSNHQHPNLPYPPASRTTTTPLFANFLSVYTWSLGNLKQRQMGPLVTTTGSHAFVVQRSLLLSLSFALSASLFALYILMYRNLAWRVEVDSVRVDPRQLSDITSNQFGSNQPLGNEPRLLSTNGLYWRRQIGPSQKLDHLPCIAICHRFAYIFWWSPTVYHLSQRTCLHILHYRSCHNFHFPQFPLLCSLCSLSKHPSSELCPVIDRGSCQHLLFIPPLHPDISPSSRWQ